ncbi:MAG TPA: hypothetical protein VF194_19605 [Ferrovibrio sp.]|uniref:hypothetical protein n=1 Tax=Ferrovibrio sp. TaxID=1917215 RepID=UPI002ED27593
MSGVVMSLEGYSDDELRQLLRLIQSVKAAAMLDLQKRFLQDAERWLHTEIGQRAQAGAGRRTA